MKYLRFLNTRYISDSESIPKSTDFYWTDSSKIKYIKQCMRRLASQTREQKNGILILRLNTLITDDVISKSADGDEQGILA